MQPLQLEKELSRLIKEFYNEWHKGIPSRTNPDLILAHHSEPPTLLDFAVYLESNDTSVNPHRKVKVYEQ